MSSKIFKFTDLEHADLVIDAIYEGGVSGNAGDDPISKLMGCGNQGGFRQKGALEDIKYCVLYSELSNHEWPDELNSERGQFIYFGDNKKPGHELHDTNKKGNLILKNTFESLHSVNRNKIPPFFIFTKVPGAGRAVSFRGLAVPGASNIAQTDDLVAVWKSVEGKRFQNYKAVFTILNEPVIKRDWIKSLQGAGSKENAPSTLSKWLNTGKYEPLMAPVAVNYRTPEQQLPQTQEEKKYIQLIKEYFANHKDGEYAFEKCASTIAQLMDPNIISCDNTRSWRDGGRDAIGVYRIGSRLAYTDVEFALEAKCYKLTSGCGVKETSRLISRLRYRQFGIFITTSYVSLQAYKEIIEDGHPLLILSATDIVQVLLSKGISDEAMLKQWLSQF
jgi:hypothetical protein